MVDNTLIPTKRLATVKLAAQLYPAFTESSLRWLIFNEHENGFDNCIRRIGRKILINLDAFETFIEQQGGDQHE